MKKTPHKSVQMVEKISRIADRKLENVESWSEGPPCKFDKMAGILWRIFWGKLETGPFTHEKDIILKV